jgi:GxxExxY protein
VGLRIETPLPDETEVLVAKTLDCAFEVHSQLGPGFLESLYARAMCLELTSSGPAVECERIVPVTYRGVPIGHHRLDLVVGGEVVVEVKATSRLEPVFHAQVISYLRAARLRVGLLINFNAPVLRAGLKRIVL